MSAVLIRQALEVGLAGMTALQTAYENAKFTPVSGVPYQRVTLLLAQPANPEIGSSYTEQGFMQVDLCYPLDNGSRAAAARAGLIRTTFYRGAPFTASGVTVTISKTPEIMPGRVEADRWVVPVRIPFHSHIRS